MTILSQIWARIWPYIAAIGAAFVAVRAIRQSGKAAGRAEVEREQDKAIIEGMKNAREARDEIDAMDDSAVRDRARQRMRNRTR